jgi:hypothetical protein
MSAAYVTLRWRNGLIEHGNSIYNKIDWLKINHPEDELYFYNGSVVVRGKDGKGFGDTIIKQYYFLESDDKKLYTLSSNKLIPI